LGFFGVGDIGSEATGVGLRRLFERSERLVDDVLLFHDRQIVVGGFVDELVGGRTARGFGQQVKMPQNPLDDPAIFDEGDDFHLGPAIGAGQGVGFPYLRNEPAPLGGGGRTMDVCFVELEDFTKQVMRVADEESLRQFQMELGRIRRRRVFVGKWCSFLPAWRVAI
jgi:hypothetical protein